MEMFNLNSSTLCSFTCTAYVAQVNSFINERKKKPPLGNIVAESELCFPAVFHANP